MTKLFKLLSPTVFGSESGELFMRTHIFASGIGITPTHGAELQSELQN